MQQWNAPRFMTKDFSWRTFQRTCNLTGRAEVVPFSKESQNGLENTKDRRSAGRHGNQHVCVRRPQVIAGDNFTFRRRWTSGRDAFLIRERHAIRCPAFVLFGLPTFRFQETDHASRRRPGRGGRRWRSAMELRMSGVPGGADGSSRASKHASLDRDQRRRRALVPDQRLSRSAPATDRNAAASSQGRHTFAIRRSQA